MNFETKNVKVYEALTDIFGSLPNTSKVIFAVDYSQNRKLSAVIVQVENASYYHGLIYFYTRSITLYDVVKYKNKTLFRLGQLSQLVPQIKMINKFILKNIPHTNPLAQRKLREDAVDIELKNDSLKNSLEQCKNKNRSFRDQIANLKGKIKILNDKNKNSSS